ncbi:MAG: hypothetical protein L3J94_00830 [Gammaproteobacteria bacterium]|nr:hypothetical protein [Gammaproteobacteria bacterium]
MDIKDFQAGSYPQQYHYKCFTTMLINHTWVISGGDTLRLLSDTDRAF